MGEKNLTLAERAAAAPPAKVEMVIPERNGVLRSIGSMASYISNGRLDINSLRPNADSDPIGLLFEREWDLLDRVAITAARPQLIGFQDLIDNNLVYPVSDGMSVMTLSYQMQSDTGPAIVTMDPRTRGRKDRPNTRRKVLPLPIIMKEWEYNIRELGTKRRSGIELDTTEAEVGGYKVSEAVEDMTFNGLDSVEFDDAVIYGYCNFPGTITDTLSVDWASSDSPGTRMVKDALNMVKVALAANHAGPFGMYLGADYFAGVCDDYKAAGVITVLQRILQIPNIKFVKYAPKMPANSVLLVELQQRTVQAVVGMETTNVQWQDLDGTGIHFRTMAIMVPRLRGDWDGTTSGIVLFTT